jgi:hypothetical protein
MALFTVSNTNDSGAGSLRQAIIDANANADADTIQFAGSMAGQTITLTSGVLVISDDLTVTGDTNGDRKADVTISGNDASRIFDLNFGGTFSVTLQSLTLTNGQAPNDLGGGGAILQRVGATLFVSNSTLVNNDAGGGQHGGAINSSGQLTVINSMIAENSASSGGAIANYSPETMTIVNSTLHNNTAAAEGGAIDTSSILNIFNSTITGNSSGNIGGGIDLFGGATANIVNSVIAGNTAAAAGADVGDFDGTATVNATNSFFGTTVLIGGSFTANLENAGDALLGALANNGGPVQTRTPLAGSPLIGAGNAALLPADAQDINGNSNTTEALPLDGTRGARIIGTLDIGAVEFAPPTIGSGGGGATAVATVAENTLAVTTVLATDPANQLINYSIFGGADAGKFTINTTTGALAFALAPDFEAPTDAGGNNIYDVIVRATDASGLTDDQAIAVTVTDVAEAAPGGGGAGGGGAAGGGDTHTLPAGGSVSGTAAQLFGDTVSGLGTTGTVKFTDTVTKITDLIINGNEIRLASGGANSTPLTLEGDFTNGKFFLLKSADGSGFELFFQKNLADVALVEGKAVSEAEVNGAPHPAALTGDGSRKFQLTLSEKATAADDNALGVYEVDAAGNIVDARILFASVKASANGTITIDGVEAGNKLGFFIVQGGVGAGAARFADTSGGSAQLTDGSNLRLTVGTAPVTKGVFHAYDKSLNFDGLTHTRSGADPSGHGVRVAFEDLSSGGDRDFQDVVFRVDVVDGNGDFLI